MVKYRHQTIPPNEFLAPDSEVHDPVKIFNVYGYCMCCCCSAVIEALNRADGREARGGSEQPQRARGPLWRRLAHVRHVADHLLPQAGRRDDRLGRRDRHAVSRLALRIPAIARTALSCST